MSCLYMYMWMRMRGGFFLLGGADECQIYTTASRAVECIFTRSYLFLLYLDRVHLTEYSTSSTNHDAMPCLPSALGQGLGAAFGLETRSR